MKKLLLIIIAINLLYCKGKAFDENQKVKYYPSEKYFESNGVVEIDLYNPNINFKKIYRRVNELHVNDSTPYFEITHDDTLRRIMPLRNDWGHGSSYNILGISKDSIWKENGYPITELYKLLKKHYENCGKNPQYSISAEKAWVEVELDTNATGSDLEKALLNLTNIFDKLNRTHADTLELKVGLSYFSQIPPPPPPPKDAENINIGI
ncbi:hypothetical protein CLV33_105322 [Jejuia pallidilutea]|uniref:Uncharacterized protein n=2 Tax=Jejuia pallidilutea TaxID=504487 RepID=A0A362XCE4_9FLAO|nr:hypothetical protein CLV33_105322 [Jejuia pallidilutea]